MAYQHDPDGPVVDKGAFRARIFEVVGIWFVAFILIYIIIKILSHSDTPQTNQEKLDSYTKALAHIFANSAMQYTVDNSNGVVTVKAWGSGIASASKDAAEGNTALLEEWENMKESFRSLAKSMYESLLEFDIPGSKVVLTVVNELNHDRSLLVFLNGELTYDAVAEYRKGE